MISAASVRSSRSGRNRRRSAQADSDGHQALDGHRGVSWFAGIDGDFPVRGQRTHTNGADAQRPRRATIAKKKAPGKK